MLRTHLETRHFSLHRSEIESMRDRLGPLASIARSFVFANLHVTISYVMPDEEYHVQGRLCLPGRVLLSGEHDSVAVTPYERCIRKLVRKSASERERRGRDLNQPRRQSHGENSRFGSAIRNDEYRAFVRELGDGERIRKRVRGWVRQRVGSEIGLRDGRVLDDLVEEVVLSAFERCDSRPSAMRLSEWIEILIDPSLRSMLGRPDEPNQAVSYARSLRDLRAGRPERRRSKRDAGPDRGFFMAERFADWNDAGIVRSSQAAISLLWEMRDRENPSPNGGESGVGDRAS